MVRRNNLYANLDWLTIFIWGLLIIFGWMNIYSANLAAGDGTVLDFSQRYGKQLLWILATLVLIAIIFILDSKFFSFFAYPLYIAMIISLILVLLLGREVHGAKSWFAIGNFQFQPSEFAKPITALALARLLSTHGFVLKGLKSTLRAGVIIFSPALLILLQPDAGSAMVYFAFLFVLFREGFSRNTMILLFTLALLFIATLLVEQSYIIITITAVSLILIRVITGTGRIPLILLLVFGTLTGGLYLANRYTGATFSLLHSTLAAFLVTTVITIVMAIRARIPAFYKVIVGMVVATVFTVSVDYAMNNLLKEHQQQRIYVTLGIEDDPQGVGYNVNQSKIAIGSGGFSGKGFLQGTQTKLHFVPEQSTDFIFCTVGEEWGFLGTAIVVLLYVVLLIRLIILSERQRSVFSRVVGYGLISVLFVHFAVNIGMTIGLLPVIGIPLPFFSYGGSSLWAFTMFLFIFLKLDSNRMELLR